MDSPGWSGFVLAQVTNGPVITQSIALIITLCLCALASAAETSLTSVNRIRIKNQAEEGDERAKQIERLLKHPDEFLTTILVINNVAIILASSLGTVIAISFWPQWGQVISTVVISLVALVCCEVTPKNAAVQNADSWARFFAPTIMGAAWLLRPINWLLNGLTASILRLAGIPMHRTGPLVTEDELRLLVNVGEEEGVLEEDERSMIHNIFTLDETTVREVMVPRIDMVTLEASATMDEAVNLITQGGQSRIPVYEETIDNILGVLYAKDLLREMRVRPPETPVRGILRPAYFVPESKKLDDLLHELQNQRVHMAIIFDESGAISGLVTIEDLVEEIVGEIQDEYDIEETLFERVSPTEYIVDARMNIDDFGELIDEELEMDEDYDSVAGFVLAKLDKIPSVGDAVQVDGVTLTVLATRGRRITKVKAVLDRAGQQEDTPNNNHSDDTDHAHPAQPTSRGRGPAIRNRA